uniref:guanylate cyclase n=1 Tax=Octopus bimaculoides TaxID=37653 RepID=A0A0L8GP16_OCTBM
MTLACLILISSWMFVTGKLQISFLHINTPPTIIPDDPAKLYYSVPLNQMISKPIIVYVYYSNGTPFSAGREFNTTATIDSYAVLPSGEINKKDTWADSGGKLCQKSAWWLDYPERYNRHLAKTRCHTPHSSILMESQIFNGRVIFDWIYHEHTIVPPSRRLFRIEIPDHKIFIDTSLISVTKPAHRLVISQQPPLKVVANSDFDVEVEIRDEDECFLDIERSTRLSSDRKFITFQRLTSEEEKRILPVVFTKNFTVLPQTLFNLQPEKTTTNLYSELKNKVTNVVEVPISCPLLNGLSILALDISKRRIFSGPHSNSHLSIHTVPTNICLSKDYSTNMSEGKIHLLVSICEVVNSVKLIIIPNGKIYAAYTTPVFRIIGTITIGHFGDLRFSGDGREIDSHINSFIRFAINDVNNGIIVPELRKKGMKFFLKSYNIPNEKSATYRKLEDLKTISTNIRLVISSIPANVAKDFCPLLVKFMIPFISTIDSTREFLDKDVYPFYNSISWSEEEFYNSVFQSAKDRFWTDIVILRYYDINLTALFYSVAIKYNIDLRNEFVFGAVKDLKPKNLYDRMLKKKLEAVKKTNLKVIFLFAPFHIQPFVFREAYLMNVSSLHGFQWVLMKKYAREFPFENHSVCNKKLECTLAFTGTYLIDSTYNVSGYQTDSWKRVLNYYFKEDRVLYKGGRVRYRSFEIGALMGLGYDAVHLYAKTLSILVNKRLTISGTKVNWLLRKTTIHGLTDKVALNAYGDRIGYFGYLAQVYPIPRWPYLPKSKVITYVKCIKRSEDGIQLEIPYESKILPHNKTAELVAFPISKAHNTRTYISLSGMVGLDTQKMMPKEGEEWPPTIFIRTESIVPPYYCANACGEKLKDPSNINIFEGGICRPDNKCECFEGFSGKRCHTVQCYCVHGLCTNDGSCICKPGYTGPSCRTAICEDCHFGVCVKPGVCECNTLAYFGENCDMHISTIIFPILFGAFLLIGILYFMGGITSSKTKNIMYQQWMIDWNNVIVPGKLGIVGQPTGIINKSVSVYRWDDQDWYVKKINSKTIPPDDKRIISDMVKLTKTRHCNLIQYGGCCLTYPNVSLFVEIADKGSVADVLANDTFETGWEFGFSFLKDICCGMEFLHDNSEIKTHGRLKSSNCLVDKRWTVRLSGFDTVNTASRMQSSSYALHIQVSESTAAILDSLGGYKLECRGKREVRGRGVMTTYWLWGKDSFMKELPDISLAVPLSEHKFK